MARERVSTTVDGDLLSEARAQKKGLSDSARFDAALAALVQASRRTEIDAAYTAYDAHPLDEPDDWGDLASFRDAASASRLRRLSATRKRTRPQSSLPGPLDP